MYTGIHDIHHFQTNLYITFRLNTFLRVATAASMSFADLAQASRMARPLKRGELANARIELCQLSKCWGHNWHAVSRTQAMIRKGYIYNGL